MCHELLTQHALGVDAKKGTLKKKGTLSEHFVTHVVPPLPAPFPVVIINTLT